MISGKHMEFINYQDKAYWVYRKIPSDRIKEGHILDVRDAWHCDTVLRTRNQDNEILLFLVEISDAEIIKEDEETQPSS